MDHKYSTISLIGLIAILTIGAVISFESEDIDEICKENESIIYKLKGEWVCGKMFNTTTKTKLNMMNYNITNNSNIEINGCIKYNCTGTGGCITLGVCK